MPGLVLEVATKGDAMFRPTPHGPGGPGQVQGKASQAEGSECLLHLGTSVSARRTHLCAQLCGVSGAHLHGPHAGVLAVLWMKPRAGPPLSPRGPHAGVRGPLALGWQSPSRRPLARPTDTLQVQSPSPWGALGLQGAGSFLGPVWVLLGCPGDSGFPLLHCLCHDSVYLDGSAGDRGHGELMAAHGDLRNGVLSNRSAFGRPHPRLRAPREGAQGGTTGAGLHGDQSPCVP